MTAATSTVEGTALSKSFMRRDGSCITLFRDFSVCIDAGEMVGLMGPSGQGKSTLGNILLGITRPDKGRIMWNGSDIAHMPKAEKAELRPRFQKIQQDPGASFPPRCTLRNLFGDFFRWGRHPLLPNRQEWDRALSEGMERASLDEKLLDRFPCQLSGGELQRFALLRAMLFSPLFLVADEPTSRLDTSVQAKVARMLESEAKEKDTAILFISHDRALLEALCSRIVTLG